jgi:hypothetical protein
MPPATKERRLTAVAEKFGCGSQHRQLLKNFVLRIGLLPVLVFDTTHKIRARG